MANHDGSINKRHQPLTLSSPKQRQGSYFEQQACAVLQQQGLALLAQNWYQPKIGELDLVMLEAGKAWSTLVFIEVRQRLRSGFGDAALSVTAAKQRKIIKTAQYFLLQYPEYAHYDCRFDVIAYNVDKPANKATLVKQDKINHLNVTSNTDITSNPIHQPEWLIGAFVAKAW